MFYRIANLIFKELIQVSRDWLLIAVLILAPIFQLSLMGWTTGKSVSDLSLAVLDMDHSTASRAIALALDNRKELALRYYATDMAELARWLEDGDADIGVIIPPHFESDLGSSTGGPEIQVIAAAVNHYASSAGLSAAQQAISAYLAGRGATAAASIIDLRTEVEFNPTMDSRQYTIPAMTGMIVFELALLLAALGLAREREIGTLEQLIIMPFQRIEIIVGKAIPPLLITLIDFPLMLYIAVEVFGTPMRGSLPLLLALTALFITAEIAWGLVLSTLARTQQQAMLFVFVEAITDLTFSGFLVPVQNLPWFINIFSNIVPLRHYLVIIRGVMLKGATLDVLWPQAVALAALAIVIGA